MSLRQEIENVDSLESLLKFVHLLAIDHSRVSGMPYEAFGEQGDWQNSSISSYLHAISNWAQDAIPPTQNPDWQFIATLFYVGKIYE